MCNHFLFLNLKRKKKTGQACRTRAPPKRWAVKSARARPRQPRVLRSQPPLPPQVPRPRSLLHPGAPLSHFQVPGSGTSRDPLPRPSRPPHARTSASPCARAPPHPCTSHVPCAPCAGAPPHLPRPRSPHPSTSRVPCARAPAPALPSPPRLPRPLRPRPLPRLTGRPALPRGPAAAAASSEPHCGRHSQGRAASLRRHRVQAEGGFPLRAAFRRWEERRGEAPGKSDR